MHLGFISGTNGANFLEGGRHQIRVLSESSQAFHDQILVSLLDTMNIWMLRSSFLSCSFIKYHDIRRAREAQQLFDGYRLGDQWLQVVAYDPTYKFRHSSSSQSVTTTFDDAPSKLCPLGVFLSHDLPVLFQVVRGRLRQPVTLPLTNPYARSRSR